MNVFSNKIKYIGFDMDGTLYDEFDFIVQPYIEISNLFFLNDKVYEYMIFRWLEKGSSYNKIFDEVYSLYPLANTTKEEFIKQALNIFREYKPTLSLSTRVIEILKYFKQHYTIFLVTDGNSKLQERKFKALNLEEFFKKSNVIFTGCYSSEYHKPNVKATELLNINPEETIFYGDRQIDKKFALDSGMQFKKVYNMIEVK